MEGRDEALGQIKEIEQHLVFSSGMPSVFYIETGWPCYPAILYLA